MPTFDPNDPNFSSQIGKIGPEHLIDSDKIKAQLTNLLGESFKTASRLAASSSKDITTSFVNAFTSLGKEGIKTFTMLSGESEKVSKMFSGIKDSGVDSFQHIARNYETLVRTFPELEKAGVGAFSKIFMEASELSGAFSDLPEEGSEAYDKLFSQAEKIEKDYLKTSSKEEKAKIEDLMKLRDEEIKQIQATGASEIGIIRKNVKDEFKLHDLIGSKQLSISKKVTRAKIAHQRKINQAIRSGSATQARAGMGALTAGGAVATAAKLNAALAAIAGAVMLIKTVVDAITGETKRLESLTVAFRGAGLLGAGRGGLEVGPTLSRALQKRLSAYTDVFNLTDIEIQKMITQLGSASPKFLRQISLTSEGAAENLENMADATALLGGLAGKTSEESFQLMIQAMREINMPANDMVSALKLAMGAIQETNIGFNDLFNTFMTFKQDLRALTTDAESADKIFALFTKTISKTTRLGRELSVTEQQKFGAQLVKGIAGLDFGRLIEAGLLASGRILGREELLGAGGQKGLVDQPVKILQALFKPVLEQFPERTGQEGTFRVEAIRQRAERLGLGGFSQAVGADFLENILTQAGTDFESASKMLDKRLEEMIPEEKKLSDAIAAGTQAVKNLEGPFKSFEKLLSDFVLSFKNEFAPAWTKFVPAFSNFANVQSSARQAGRAAAFGSPMGMATGLITRFVTRQPKTNIDSRSGGPRPNGVRGTEKNSRP